MVLQGSCEWTGSEKVTITAEDFRFTPNQVQVRPDQPFTLTLRNLSRERHVFQSPRLFGKAGIYPGVSSLKPEQQQGDALILEPGSLIEVVMNLPSGVYPFRCWIKGHAGMEGALLVFKMTLSMSGRY